MCLITLSNYVSGETSNGTWTQIVNQGNSTINIINGTIQTDDVTPGLYTFVHTVSNAGCVDTAVLNITIISGGISNLHEYCQTNINSNFNIFTQTDTDFSTHTLAYQSNSPTDPNINITTGNYVPNLIAPNIYTILVTPIVPTAPECNCVRTYTIYSVGCVNTELNVNGCTVSWTAMCNGTTNTYTLQEKVNNNWVNLTTASPYTVPNGQVKTLRLKTLAPPCLPIYSQEHIVSCQPDLCDTCDLNITLGQNIIGALSAGNIISSCTVGDFVIDWYLNDTNSSPVLITGRGTHPDIQYLHPFTGNNSIPVPGGIYIPRIRFIVLNGTLYSSSAYPGGVINEGLATCLPQVTILNHNCNNGTLTNDLYTHLITHNNSADPDHLTTTTHLTLNSSTDFVAYEFNGGTTGDRLRLIKVVNNIETVLEDVVVGTDNVTSSVNTIPKMLDYTSVKGIVDVQPYTSGAYLKIRVTPNFNSPSNQLTSWSIKFKCLDSFDCSCAPPTAYGQGPTLHTCASGGCVTTMSTLIIGNNFSCYSSYNYVGVTNEVSELKNDSEISVGMNITNTATPGCKVLLGSVTYTKTGPTLTMSFTNNADYTYYKNQITATMPVNFGNECTNNLDINYYRHYTIDIYTNTSCANTITSLTHTGTPCSYPVFNDGSQTITFTFITRTLGLVSTPCAHYEALPPIINNINNTVTSPNYTYTRTIAANNFITTITPVAFVNTDILLDTGYSAIHFVPELIASSIRNACNLFSCTPQSFGVYKRIFFARWESEEISIDDVCNWFEVRFVPPVNGCVSPTAPPSQLFYRKQNGVQTFP